MKITPSNVAFAIGLDSEGQPHVLAISDRETAAAAFKSAKSKGDFEFVGLMQNPSWTKTAKPRLEAEREVARLAGIKAEADRRSALRDELRKEWKLIQSGKVIPAKRSFFGKAIVAADVGFADQRLAESAKYSQLIWLQAPQTNQALADLCVRQREFEVIEQAPKTILKRKSEPESPTLNPAYLDFLNRPFESVDALPFELPPVKNWEAAILLRLLAESQRFEISPHGLEIQAGQDLCGMVLAGLRTEAQLAEMIRENVFRREDTQQGIARRQSLSMAAELANHDAMTHFPARGLYGVLWPCFQPALAIPTIREALF